MTLKKIKIKDLQYDLLIGSNQFSLKIISSKYFFRRKEKYKEQLVMTKMLAVAEELVQKFKTT